MSDFQKLADTASRVMRIKGQSGSACRRATPAARSADCDARQIIIGQIGGLGARSGKSPA